ncbi:hypothetical protein AB0D67_03050 [Streptosporangium sp. NPDC048047]|uniref:hypothetical protein n=1 Tax=Streptosporangium sp. NPDC048047 TaxID=3155748 RepID=UPI0034254891
MADVDGDSSGRSHERYIPSYEAPTAPMPAVQAEDGTMIGTRVPRRFPIGDGEETLLVPRIDPDGSFPAPERPSPAGDRSGRTEPPVPQVPPSPSGGSPTGPARRGGLSLRAVYSIVAALLTAAAVVLVFVLFSGDEPPERSAQPRQEGAAAPGAKAVPTITLPGRPKMKALATLPGTPSGVVGSVTDTMADITYAKLGSPWKTAAVPSFSVGQQVGAARLPRTVVGSGMLPGATPATAPKTYTALRTAAMQAVKWTAANHHPPGGKITWTASQKAAGGRGWTLGYRVTYVLDGRKHISQAAVTVLDVGRRKPAMLFVTVPDSRKQLWADIAPLMASARPL